MTGREVDEGRLEEGEALVEHEARLGARTLERDAYVSRLMCLFMIRREQARLRARHGEEVPVRQSLCGPDHVASCLRHAAHHGRDIFTMRPAHRVRDDAGS